MAIQAGSGFLFRSILHKSFIPICSNYYSEMMSDKRGAVFVSKINMHDLDMLFLGKLRIISNCLIIFFLHFSYIDSYNSDDK